VSADVRVELVGPLGGRLRRFALATSLVGALVGDNLATACLLGLALRFLLRQFD
jgi:hypothetical protein